MAHRAQPADRGLKALTFDLNDAIVVLGNTPGTLRALLRGLGEPWTRATEGGDSWSAFDVVGHLIDGEETDWIPRARIILEQGTERRFRPFDRFRHLERNRGRTLASLLDEFESLRGANLRTLGGWKLTNRQLSLEGVHPEFGAVTLEQLLATWVVHDLGHVSQISRVLAKHYTPDVGPWRAYLPVLQR